jgi:hypothetical protein
MRSALVFLRSPRKSIRTASKQLHLPHSTVNDVVHKRLRLRAYKLQLRQHIKPADRDCRKKFCEEMLQKIDSDETFLDSVCFSDEVTFHVNGGLEEVVS